MAISAAVVLISFVVVVYSHSLLHFRPSVCLAVTRKSPWTISTPSISASFGQFLLSASVVRMSLPPPPPLPNLTTYLPVLFLPPPSPYLHLLSIYRYRP